MSAGRTRGAPAVAPPDSTVRRRPKDRKAQIVRVAARAFSDRGYHQVGVDEIAAEIGISGPALYRHFANKYALLVAATEGTATALLQAARAADDPGATPENRLTALIRALTETMIELRREAGLYRWERRYLAPEDRLRIRGIYVELRELLAAPITLLRPNDPPEDIELIVISVSAAIGSINAHRTQLPNARLIDLMQEICWSLLRTELPPAPGAPDPQEPVRGLPLSSKREQLLAEAIRIFGRKGYHEAAIEEIGAAVGINASSVYRYFSSKSDLLIAAFHRSGERLAIANAEALSEAVSRPDAAVRIAARFARLTFTVPEILAVYFSEFAQLPAADQHRLRALQRQNVLEWAHLLDGDPAEARFRVNAAIGQVLDVGRHTRFDTRPENLARVTALMSAALLGNAS
ncbi:TetR/AcrR family transcriptional regulator [Nocardia stercoris]|uniref:TetR/AcrR family transcriptional regulator n=1 Tax=Nocardia stercoris TaxID=2483361 RepID=A0A3M2L2I4_9NOCA|nr:TetR/AcrR family transcriptional regulator [Nocardia stercoris]RMI31922.1 TetR/AcrR family transcriptional regulator [Nocardia stercoris]